ncbi:MAG: hypothetical protein KJI69_04570 [Patescibacteria group bacterium]|nr:hypothetical protein [Patescibacteria group bacterium]
MTDRNKTGDARQRPRKNLKSRKLTKEEFEKTIKNNHMVLGKDNVWRFPSEVEKK